LQPNSAPPNETTMDSDEEEELAPTIGSYVGDTHPETNERHGKGRAELPNGDIYDGEYENGKRHGKGVYKFKKSKARYDGAYADNKKHGEGTFYYPDGSIYKGSWAEDKRTGTGTYTYPNGDTYEGGWAMDARDGFGVYTYADTGSKYEGSWSNGKRHGDGKFVHKTHQYEGNFTDDQALGVGKFYFDSGAIQKGSFVVDGADDAGENEDEAAKPTMKWVGSEISMKTA